MTRALLRLLSRLRRRSVPLPPREADRPRLSPRTAAKLWRASNALH